MTEFLCWFHHIDEPIDQDTYRVCLECGHVYQTKADLEQAYLQEITELNKSVVPWGNPDFELTEPLRFKDGDEIFSCPLCIHDF